MGERRRYVFDQAKRELERERLAAIEALFDSERRRFLEATGLAAGWRCLEVGAGAGSVARFLADRGASVLALDRDARLLHEASHPSIDVLEVYDRFAQEPRCWAVYYAAVRARASRVRLR